jgi:hypothetical protein
MSSLAALVLVAAASVGAEAAAHPNPNPLQEYADDFLGTWVREGARGEKIRWSYAWALQQTILEFEVSREVLDKKPVVMAKGITAWNPATNLITNYWFATDSIGQTTVTKEGDHIWVHKDKLIQPNGKESLSTIRIEAGNNVYRVKIESGEHVYRREQ